MITTDTVGDAAASAAAAAARGGLRMAPLETDDQQRAAADLFCRVWGADSPDRLVNSALMRALAHSGNYLAGAYAAERLVGAAIGFLGPGHLHSHITGVDPAAQRSGVGYALKLHQRAWALRHGVPEVRWTFDPLVRRNAYFNLHKLGASVTDYLPDFYGLMEDGINTGDATDRLYLHWVLASPRAVAAAHGDPADVDATAARAAGAQVLLDRADDEPVPAGEPAAEALLVAVPSDIESMRSADPARAARWRYAVRAALTGAVGSGYAITGISRDGFYVLRRGAS